LVALSKWEFDLYIVGETPKAHFAYANLEKFCSEYVKGDCKITVYDLLNNPKLAVDNQITATPVAVRRHPLPQRFMVGDLSDTKTIITLLGLK
jgi:circadian clock protein KaiB